MALSNSDRQYKWRNKQRRIKQNEGKALCALEQARAIMDKAQMMDGMLKRMQTMDELHTLIIQAQRALLGNTEAG